MPDLNFRNDAGLEKIKFEEPKIVKGPHESIPEFYERAQSLGIGRQCLACNATRRYAIIACPSCGSASHRQIESVTGAKKLSSEEMDNLEAITAEQRRNELLEQDKELPGTKPLPPGVDAVDVYRFEEKEPDTSNAPAENIQAQGASLSSENDANGNSESPKSAPAPAPTPKAKPKPRGKTRK
jgi:hypothetical protein